MSPKASTFLAVVFVAPVLLCLIGIGAFLHISAASGQVPNSLINQLPEKLQAEENGIRMIKERLDAAAKTISDLGNTMQKEKEQAERAKANKGKEQKADSTAKDLQYEVDCLEEKIKQMEEAIQNLKSQIEKLSGTERINSTLEELQKRLEEAKQEKEKLLAELDELLSKGKRPNNSYKILPPFDPGNGTNKPATFVECMAAGIVIQPQGQKLNIDPNSQAKEAFLSAVKKTGYVVFLIRPDGAKSFNEYFGLVISENESSTNQIDVGYEPVDADWILSYPEQKG